MKRQAMVATVIAFSILTFAGTASSQEKAAESNILDKNKKEIIEDLGVLEQGLYKTKECVYGAQTPQEIARCREHIRMLQFEKVQRELNEMGMTREERLKERFPQEK
ncbi:MAG: hypothetical protein HGA78_07445 [Nitrospirales bacterium]|nr:hypothetical protein [Nitrospirales bacterium]